MNIEQQLLKMVDEYTFDDGVSSRDCMFMKGCIELYKKSGNQAIYHTIEQYTKERMSGPIIDLLKLSNNLRFLWESTNDNCYKDSLQNNYNHILKMKGENGILHLEDGIELSAPDCYEWMPFYAWFDTNFNKKENYIDIMNQLNHMKNQMSMTETWNEKCTYMMTFADTLLCMSEEIYEYYAKIRAWVKEAVHKNLYVVSKDCIRMSYVVLKGCESKALLPEKYEQIGKNMLTCAMDKLLTHPIEDKEELGILLMTYALI